jgi:hypothetical protein
MALTDFLRRHWRAHRWRVVGVGVVVCLALLAGVIHLPVVRAGVLSRALTFLRDSGVRADVRRLDYNLFTLTVRLNGIALSAERSDTPFFSAEAVDLDLPWSVVGGTVAVQSLEVDRPRITIVREADGSLNLPEIAQTEDEAESAPPGPLRIDRLVIRDLNASYGDASLPLSVDGRGVTLDLDSTPGAMLAGRLSMSDGVELRLGDRETAVSTLEGGLAFDGTALSVDARTVTRALAFTTIPS